MNKTNKVQCKEHAGGWLVSYKGHNEIHTDKEEALKALAQTIDEFNIDLPEELKRFKQDIGVQRHYTKE